MARATSADISITLPDGAVRVYAGPTTGGEIAADISKSLAKKALACKINGVLSDLSREITEDSAVAIVTREDKAEALELVRHDLAHVMARAVQEIWPGTKVTIGPVIDHGFYYDFDRAEPFVEADFERIEAAMRRIIARRDPVRTEVWSRERALAHYRDAGEPYKVELVEAIPEGEDVRMYWHGDWQDLCRGPHLAHTGQCPADAFKLTAVAGAYWRGDSARPMLQRIYATAWRDRQELQAHLTMMEEAAARDHRRLGVQMDLFHLQEEAPGMVFWHPNGWRLYTALQDYMRRRVDAAGYEEVRTPQVIDRKLWEASGHWDKYRENMFIVEVDEGHAAGKRVNALKPMNCPAHVLIYNNRLKSYRDLPYRMAEFGACHRYETSGSMHGLMRVRSFTQDDAHIFCTEDQIASETADFIDLLASVYRDLGFDAYRIMFSDRPTVRAGSDMLWDKAEAALRGAAEAAGVDVEDNPGDGAFYGPKLDFVLTDAIGREWQCGTFQADFVLPERLGAEFVGPDNGKHTPVMLHRAILGSFERFIGVMIEQYAGRFPLWLAPRQVVVATIVSDADAYAEAAVQKLRAAGLRVEHDLRNEKINYKVREHSTAKVPVILSVGRREVESGSVSMRRLGADGSQTMTLDAAVAMLVDEATPPDMRRAKSKQISPD